MKRLSFSKTTMGLFVSTLTFTQPIKDQFGVWREETSFGLNDFESLLSGVTSSPLSTVADSSLILAVVADVGFIEKSRSALLPSPAFFPRDCSPIVLVIMIEFGIR